MRIEERGIIRGPSMKFSAVILGITTALALLAVDSTAAAAFDAPQRFIATLGIAAALAAAALSKAQPKIPRAALAMLAAVALCLIASASLSPRRPIAFDTLRTMVLFSSVALLASMSKQVWRSVTGGFVVAALLNATLALLQWTSIFQPFQYATVGGRANTSALIGNTGTLGLVAALAAVILFSKWLEKRSWLTAGAIALLVAAVLVNRALTGILVLASGVLVLLWLARDSWPRSSVRIAGALLLASVLAIVGYGVVARDSLRSVNDLLSFRLFPWSAAAEMFLDRPVTGWGPGTFAAEFMPHAIAAEIRWQKRLVNPHLSGAYAEAHSDYLQALGELGAPATILLVLVGALAIVRSREPLARAVVVAIAIAALAWFPLQRPTIAILLLAAIGASFARDEEPSGKRSVKNGPHARLSPSLVIAALAAVVLLVPEFARYRGERHLARVQAAAQTIGSNPQLALGLPRLAAEAATIRTWPGDWRPSVTAGAAWFSARNADRAVEAFRSALEGGERPEVDINLGLALAMRGDQQGASAAIVRGAWVSPALLPSIQERTGADLRPTLAELERRLYAGTLSEALPRAPSTNPSSRPGT